MFYILVITDKIRKDDEAAEITNEWKFAVRCNYHLV